LETDDILWQVILMWDILQTSSPTELASKLLGPDDGSVRLEWNVTRLDELANAAEVAAQVFWEGFAFVCG
jgi:hypothetical protein